MHSISRTPFPASRKIYVDGVAMREITLTNTRLHGSKGEEVPNAPVVVYDTSGPYTDPDAHIDVRQGLPRLREKWILDRDDVDKLPGITSDYGRQRLEDNRLDSLRFSYQHSPMRAKAGHNVSQMHYAKKGIITREMEYIATRENQCVEKLFQENNALWQQHKA